MINVVVYTKEGCHLCERVIAELRALNRIRPFELFVTDITTDSELFVRYKNMIPVVAVNGKVKLAGAALANPNSFKEALRRAIYSVE